MKKLTLKICLTLCLLLIAVQPAAANTKGDFTIYPTYVHESNSNWIILDATKDSFTSDYVTIENLSDQNQTIQIQVREAEQKGDSFLSIEDQPLKNIGNWINIDDNFHTLAPHEKKNIPLEINIPKDADLGEYTASILASKADINSQNIKIVTRIGVRVYLNVVEENMLQTNIFSSTTFPESYFFFLSFFGLLATIFYNIIHFRDYFKNAKKRN